MLSVPHHQEAKKDRTSTCHGLSHNQLIIHTTARGKQHPSTDTIDSPHHALRYGVGLPSSSRIVLDILTGTMAGSSRVPVSLRNFASAKAAAARRSPYAVLNLDL